eukprot:763727-Prorocentrum_minimum.AAC.4
MSVRGLGSSEAYARSSRSGRVFSQASPSRTHYDSGALKRQTNPSCSLFKAQFRRGPPISFIRGNTICRRLSYGGSRSRTHRSSKVYVFGEIEATAEDTTEAARLVSNVHTSLVASPSSPLPKDLQDNRQEATVLLIGEGDFSFAQALSLTHPTLVRYVACPSR